jgi:peptide/nickel transport system substrate-binding protein
MARWWLPVLLALTAAACQAAVPPPRGSIVIALQSSPTNLDPGIGLDESSQRVHALIFSSLLRIDDNLRNVPDLATRFETTDYRSYVAAIPAGVRFHDGREMTSADVAYTFRRFLDPAFVSGRKGAYQELVSVDTLDRYTVAFRLRAPSASFPANLTNMGIVPEGSSAALGRAPIGSGPYRFVEFLPDDHVTLAANPSYYRGAPKNEGLVFKVVPDETMRGLELRKGDVDLIVNDLSPDMIHGLQETGTVSVITGQGTDYAYMGLNLRDPILQDRRVRHAIGYAIDRDAIIKYLRRGQARLTAGIVPSMSWAAADDVFTFSHDVARARALLDEAGFPDPDGAGPRPRLTLSLKTSTSEVYRVQAAALQQQLAAAGIALEIRSYEFATLFSDVIRGNVQLYTLVFTGGSVADPDILRRVFHSTQTPPSGFNRAYYSNPEVDRLLDLASTSFTDAERRRAYVEAQRLIALDAPMISLWARTNVAVAQRSLTGIRLSPIGDLDFLRDVSRNDGSRRDANARSPGVQ